MSSTLRHRGSATVPSRQSQDSNRSIESVRELKEEFARSLIREARLRNTSSIPRPSEMVAADKLKLEFEEVVDDSHDSDENPDAEPDDHGESNPSTLDEYLMGHESSDDDEENAKAAEFLLRLKSGNEHKELKRVWKKEGRRWYARRATWIWALILVAMGCLIALGVVRMTDGGFTRAFQAWRLAFFLATCPLCWIGAKILTFLTIKIVEKTVITRPSALYIVYAIRRSLLLLLASVLVLIAWACWQFIENTQSSAVTTVMMWILRAMGIVSLFLLGQLLKKMLAKMLLTILTGTNQRERMESALQQEKLLGKLMAPRPLEIDSLRAPGGRLKERPVVDVHVVSNSDVESTPTSPTRRGEKIRETVSKFSSLASGFLTGDDEDGEDDAGKRKRKRVTPLRRAQQLERLNRLEKYLRKRNLHVTLHDQLNQVEDVAVDSSTYQRLGQFLFFHLTHDVDAKEVTRDDIKVFVRKDKEVDAAFAMLDHNGDGTIDCDDCIQALERVYFDRNNLANTLRDSRSINGVVELLLGALIHIILFFVYLLILQVSSLNSRDRSHASNPSNPPPLTHSRTRALRSFARQTCGSCG